MAAPQHEICVPRYLFRTWSPSSDGLNSAYTFQSLAFRNNVHNAKQLSDLEFGAAKSIVSHHIFWESKKLCQQDILISFTSSFLFALQHCIRKINTTWENPRSTADNSHITIIDTKVAKVQFLKTTHLIEKYELSPDRPFIPYYHEPEYLAEYQVDLSSNTEAATTVRFADLLQKGLYKLVPELNKAYKNDLQIALGHLRIVRYNTGRLVSADEARQVDILVSCFGGKWRQLMCVWALALSQRSENDLVLLSKLRINRNCNVARSYLSDIGIPGNLVREEQEFRKLIAIAAGELAPNDTKTGGKGYSDGITAGGERREGSGQSKQSVTPLLFTSAAALFAMQQKQQIDTTELSSFSNLSHEMSKRGF